MEFHVWAGWRSGCAAIVKFSDQEHLINPPDLVEADEGAAEDNEGFVDVGAPLVADGQTAEAVEPGERSFDDPAVAAQPLAAVDATLRNAGGDCPGAAFGPAPVVVVGLVGVKLVRPLARAATAMTHTCAAGLSVVKSPAKAPGTMHALRFVFLYLLFGFEVT